MGAPDAVAAGIVPEQMPELASSDSPAGSPCAENVSGASPVAGTAYTKLVPGRAENAPGAWMRGDGADLLVDIVMSVAAARAGSPTWPRGGRAPRGASPSPGGGVEVVVGVRSGP